ncbi:hypothetical protein ACXEO8_06975 [Cytobacillus firmus]
MVENTCENCWQWEQPEYSQEAGICRLDNFNTFGSTKACEGFENKFSDDKETK